MIARRTLLAAPTLLIAGPALAHSYTAGDVMIGHPWCLPSTGPTTRAMAPLGMRGAVGDALISASTPVASGVEFIATPGQPAVPRWEIAPRRPIAMRPDGPHLLLTGLTRPLRSGDRALLTLRFERAGARDVELWVESRAYGG